MPGLGRSRDEPTGLRLGVVVRDGRKSQPQVLMDGARGGGANDAPSAEEVGVDYDLIGGTQGVGAGRSGREGGEVGWQAELFTGWNAGDDDALASGTNHRTVNLKELECCVGLVHVGDAGQDVLADNGAEREPWRARCFAVGTDGAGRH